MMSVIRSIRKMARYSSARRARGKTIAFVPTMGYLHEGHARLLEVGRKAGDILVLSIFVNPTQFGPTEDFSRYPRDMARDLAIARKGHVDVVFAPTAGGMYPEGFQTSIHVENVTRTLCGPRRPGHFPGVATVVAKLFNIVRPTAAIFGLKDFQQTVVLRRMVEDLNMGIRIIGVPTVREKDGLAMSSRNSYLSADERRAAASIPRSLRRAREIFRLGTRDARTILREVHNVLEQEPLVRPEYASLVDSRTLEEVRTASRSSLVALAVRIGRTRLIDNMCLG